MKLHPFQPSKTGAPSRNPFDSTIFLVGCGKKVENQKFSSETGSSLMISGVFCLKTIKQMYSGGLKSTPALPINQMWEK
jgi:hypothetical protein